MRSEREMMDLILGVAKADGRIRAAYLNGSRANPRVAKDPYRDYDVVYVVEETASFLADKGWISVFGEPAIVQEPDSNDLGWGIGHDFSRSYTWLMLFTDFTRIDLHIETAEAALEGYGTDTLTLPLLDKDGILPALPPSDDTGYRIQRPSKSHYDGCCNEFWWCLNNVAKGIVRDQLPYAMRMYTGVVLPELENMTAWRIGIETDFSVSVGMWGKQFRKYLSPERYERYRKTYPDGDYAHFWEAVFTACALFRELGGEVGAHFGYAYPVSEDGHMMRYLRYMQDEFKRIRKGGNPT